MEINQIKETCNKIATDKGFWDDLDNMIKKMKGLSKHFDDHNIERIKLAFYCEKISLISSELGEAIESMRLGRFYKSGENGIKILFDLVDKPFQFQGTYSTHFKDTFEDEIADSFIRLFDLCYKMDIDIEKFIMLKLEFNKNRYDKHGKKF